jgi:thioesterase domain-containing protein
MDGVIAYETALQLQAQGDEVALLVLFDAANPATLKEFSKLQLLKVQPFLLIQKWIFRLAKLRQATLKQAVAHVRQSLRLRLELLSYKIWEVNYKFHLRVGRRIEGGLRDFEKIALHAMFNYRPKPYPGRVVLIRAESRPKGRFRDDKFGWSPLLAGEFEVRFIPGGHNDMFQEPGVETLAKTLNTCLDAAQETSPGNYRRGGFSI